MVYLADKKKEFSLAESNRRKTTEKVAKAIRQLLTSDAPINASSISKKAGISRATIYNREDIKAMIAEAQMLQQDAKNASMEPRKPHRGSTQVKRIERLRHKNKELLEEKRKLLEQNMLLTTQITKLQARLSDMEDKLFSQSEIKIVDMKSSKYNA